MTDRFVVARTKGLPNETLLATDALVRAIIAHTHDAGGVLLAPVWSDRGTLVAYVAVATSPESAAIMREAVEAQKARLGQDIGNGTVGPKEDPP